MPSEKPLWVEEILYWPSPEAPKPFARAWAVQNGQSRTENQVVAACVLKPAETYPVWQILPHLQDSQRSSPCRSYLILCLWEEKFISHYCVQSAGISRCTGLGCWEWKSSIHLPRFSYPYFPFSKSQCNVSVSAVKKKKVYTLCFITCYLLETKMQNN